MKYAIIVLALVGVLVSPRPATAGSAQYLSKLCAQKSASEEHVCMMYIIGAIDGLELMMALLKKRTICIPKYFRNSVDQQTTLVKEFMRNNPPKDNEDAEMIVFVALAKAFLGNRKKDDSCATDWLTPSLIGKKLSGFLRLCKAT
jgi:hypothetical protein